MSHFRDRVILPGNLPQLPSGVTAVAGVPVITLLPVSLVAVAIAPVTTVPPTVDLASVVPTQSFGMTSP